MKASSDLVHLLDLLHHSPVLSAYLARQFSQKNAAGVKERPRKSFRNIFLFRSEQEKLRPLPGWQLFQNEFFRNSMATQVGLRSLSFVDRYR